uniref:Uncharacterized protein n=1 Tax=Caenorhabditis japonica TaxID=281687 RepID=A0A8R1IC69_CAEJA
MEGRYPKALYVQRSATVIGCVRVFSAYEQREKCDALLFYSAFVYCVLSLALIVIFIIFLACSCILFCIGGNSNK